MLKSDLVLVAMAVISSNTSYGVGNTRDHRHYHISVKGMINVNNLLETIGLYFACDLSQPGSNIKLQIVSTL